MFTFQHIKNIKLWMIISLSVVLFIFLSIFAPISEKNFIDPKIISIEKGETIRGASRILKENNIIKSTSIFNILISIKGKSVVEGDYLFSEPESIFEIIDRITTGDYRIPNKTVTLIEGITVKQIATEIKNKIPEFDSEKFVEMATQYEGYLFPDTYHFQENVTPEEVIKKMRDNFNKKIAEISTEIEKSKYSLNEIIIMASIVEKEATKDTIQEISNILWGRIEVGMALQVDAPFVYYIGKGTFDLTMDDLDTDHPYNTYKNVGLTLTPIGNPGIETILAAANPQITENVYFLTGRDGKMYFAQNFEGHKQNRLLYLD